MNPQDTQLVPLKGDSPGVRGNRNKLRLTKTETLPHRSPVPEGEEVICPNSDCLPRSNSSPLWREVTVHRCCSVFSVFYKHLCLQHPDWVIMSE